MLKKLKYFCLITLIMSNISHAKYEKLAYDFNFTNIDGNSLKLSDYKEKIIIVINVASQCGFTSQYEDMQKIWELYKNKGFVLIGVPSNDFGSQEPGTNKEIKNFCESKFGITFPMVEKISVKGENAHPFYQWAKNNHGNSAIPKWNFHKIIIGKNGKIIDTFASITKPTSNRFIKVIEGALE